MITRGAIDRYRTWRHTGPSATIHTDEAFGCDTCGYVVQGDREGERCKHRRKHLWRRAGWLTTALALTLAGMVLYPVVMFFKLSVRDWFAGTSGHSILSAMLKLFPNNGHRWIVQVIWLAHHRQPRNGLPDGDEAAISR